MKIMTDQDIYVAVLEEGKTRSVMLSPNYELQ